MAPQPPGYTTVGLTCLETHNLSSLVAPTARQTVNPLVQCTI